MSCVRLATHPRDERDTAGVCCGHRRQQRGPKDEGEGRCLVALPVRTLATGAAASAQRDTWRLLAVWRGVRAGAPSRGRWKGDALAAAARRCLFKAGGGELARGGGEGGRVWALVDAAKNSGLGTCLVRASAQLQVWSSSGKPSAGGGALPKKGQGRRRRRPKTLDGFDPPPGTSSPSSSRPQSPQNKVAQAAAQAAQAAAMAQAQPHAVVQAPVILQQQAGASSGNSNSHSRGGNAITPAMLEGMTHEQAVMLLQKFQMQGYAV
ncbi:hypothetical protein B0H14DRAFT_3436084 [Mycena olivaceomarginata]|nr:hypothetical protein B0H14DRAFT_3436084 [Mycena olivaceomarginata]